MTWAVSECFQRVEIGRALPAFRGTGRDFARVGDVDVLCACKGSEGILRENSKGFGPWRAINHTVREEKNETTPTLRVDLKKI